MTAGTPRDPPAPERRGRRTAPGAGTAPAPTAAVARGLGSVLPVPPRLTAIQPVPSCPIAAPGARTGGHQPGSPPGAADRSGGGSPGTAPGAGRCRNTSRAPLQRVENHTEQGRERGYAHGFCEGSTFVFPVYRFFQLQVL